MDLDLGRHQNYGSILKGAPLNFSPNRSGVGKSGMLENKSGNISETRKDRGKVTMDDL